MSDLMFLVAVDYLGFNRGFVKNLQSLPGWKRYNYVLLLCTLFKVIVKRSYGDVSCTIFY